MLERGLFRYFYAREHLDQVLLTFALILLFEEFALAAGRQRLLFRAGPRAARFLRADHAPASAIRPIASPSSPSAWLLAALLFFWIERTAHGRHHPRGGRKARDGRRARHRCAARASDGVRRRHRAGAHRRRAGRSALLRLPQHGRRLPDHLLRRGGDRRARLGLRRLLVGADHRPGRHAGQGLRAAEWQGSPSTC